MASPTACAHPLRGDSLRAFRIVVATVFALTPLCAASHALDDATPSLARLPWTFEPWEIACLVLSAGLYVVGLARLWRRAGRGRGIGIAEAGAFAAGSLAIVAALVSPLDALADDLFSAHMVEHELLMIVAAPLLVLGRPLTAWLWAAPARWRGAIGACLHRPGWRVPWLVFTGPLWAFILHALALWLWHVPALFEAALENEAVHALQHISFLGTALIFWWSVLGRATRRERGIALVSLFATMVHTGALGALLTLSTVVWYPSYAASAPAWGFTALEDQELGGIIMWVPAGLVYIVTGLWLASRWLAEPRRAGAHARGRASS
ncbi:MAG: cytochrome c oxidase assembly protein [Candidatus Tumulicola sp.]